MENDEAAKRETGHRGTCTKGHKQSRSSLESIYSLKSGQSSSSKLIHAKVCFRNLIANAIQACRLLCSDNGLNLYTTFLARQSIFPPPVPFTYPHRYSIFQLGFQ
ncbi:hypothetical protein ILYODFUR_038529 [Ilyodon furcidens]|uniref:Uncharacterized protein n=1 Tax=Ilyodon furcidens TaxID=33524 RepID=A0ABV0UBV6_9TELE